MKVPPPQPITPQASSAQAKKRRGVVIVAVLVVIVLLSLAGYQYADMTLAEYKASENAHRLVQTRAIADSGVNYAMAMVSKTENLNNIDGNLWHNPKMFQDVKLMGENDEVIGRFSLIAPPEPGDAAGEVRYGLECEASKLNLNALMKLDPTGKTLNGMLMKLPNMTADIAAAIIDWMDPDSNTKTGGAESDYYSSLTPPYRARNGPIESVDELLLVKCVTRELLYGNDLNRNGIQDANEISADGFSRGWSAFLTVHSREQNRDLDGGTLVWLNNKDLKQLYDGLAAIDPNNEELAKFVVMYRQNASAEIDAAVPKDTTVGALSGYQAKFDRRASYTINSIYDLIGVRIQIGKVIYNSPLNDPAKQRELLPLLLTYGKLADVPEIVARVNVNTAPREVLMTIPGLSAADVDKIMQTRPRLSATEHPPEIFHTQAWLLTDAKFSANKMRSLDPFLTGMSQVYRVQAVGQLEGSGAAVRIEAVIDTNAGRPRIIAWRDLSELGKGLNEQPAR